MTTNPPTAAKLQVRRLSKEFAPDRRTRILALDDIDLDVANGELVCIIGPSGCGKSTLLNIIGGLERQTSGTVTVDGDPVVGPGPDRGMVFQSYSLYPWKSIEQNIEFGLECAGTPKAQRRERVDELLGTMSLTQFRDRRPSELSGGMRQRVAIARALAPAPDVLLLDEPFGALDAQTKRAMQDYLLTIWKRTASTILMVTHDVEEAIYLSRRIYVLTAHPGRVGTIIDVPFSANRGPSIKRDPRFHDLRDEIEDHLAAPPTQHVAEDLPITEGVPR